MDNEISGEGDFWGNASGIRNSLNRRNSNLFNKMPLIKTHQLKPGMVLAEGVKNHSGRKLFPEGTPLTEKQILNLKAWGITEANIQGEGGDLEPALELENIDSLKLAKAKKESRSLFRYSNQDHPAVAELMRLFCLNRLQKIPEVGDLHEK